MLVGPIAGVDYTGFEKTSEKVRRTRRTVPDDDNVGVERLEVSGRVFEGLAFFKRRGFCGEVDDVGGESLRSQFKADARPGRRFNKEEDDCFPAERRHFLDRPLADGFKG